MNELIDAVVAGHICLDIIPDLHRGNRARPEELFTPGRLVQVGSAALSSGGPVSNTGLALHRLGLRTRLMGKVGDDLFGRALLEIVTARGNELADHMIVAEDVDTSYTVIMSAPGLDRIFFHCPGANDTFTAADVRFDLLSQARLFHFGYPPVMRRMYEHAGRELVELFRRAKETGVTTSLDFTLPDPATEAGRADWRAVLAAVLVHTDVFMPSAEEIIFLLRRRMWDEYAGSSGMSGLLSACTPELLYDLADELLGWGAGIVGIKLGDRGLYVRTAGRARLRQAGRAAPADPDAWADRELWAPCFRVDAAGTTGAGDATIAGMLAALLHGLAPGPAALTAVAVGAYSVEKPDAVSGIRGWEETMERIDGGWPQSELKLEAPGWQWDKDRRLWTAGRRG